MGNIGAFNQVFAQKWVSPTKSIVKIDPGRISKQLMYRSLQNLDNNPPLSTGLLGVIKYAKEILLVEKKMLLLVLCFHEQID